MSGLKNLFNVIKKEEGSVLKDLDMYLLSLNTEVNDRAIDVNSPSSAGGCLRALYYSRAGFEQDSNSISPRLRRIFDNGHGVHERLQGYLDECGLQVMDEVPLRNDKYKIQGHTDGLINLSSPIIDLEFNYDIEEICEILDLDINKIRPETYKGKNTKHLKIAKNLGILEIKSINDRGYTLLKDAKEEHKLQAMVYCFCAETRRKYLKEKYKTKSEFIGSDVERVEYYASLYTHLKDGNKYSREEKMLFKVLEHLKTDEVLFNIDNPINKVVFLYENKNTQDLKEFVVALDNSLLNPILEGYDYLNECVDSGTIPEKAGKFKTKEPCRFCSYQGQCFVL